MGTYGEKGSGGGFAGGSAFGFGGSSGAFNASSGSHVCGSSFARFNAFSNLRDNSQYRSIESPPVLLYQNGESRVSARPTSNCMAVVASVIIVAGSLALMSVVNNSILLEMGLNYSRILKANRFLVDSITVRNLEQVPGARLYGFENQPFLNRTKEWTVHHNVLMPEFHHQEWAFWLNHGSKVNIVYSLPPTDSLFIIVARGKANFNDWIQHPFNSDSCLLWRSVHDNGQISFEADNDGDYYFGLGNLYEKSVETKLEIEVKSKIYETETANSGCSLDQKLCKILLSFFGSEVGLLTTTDMPQEGIDVWQVEISYKARWVVYLLLDGALLFVVFLVWLCLCKSCSQHNLQPEENPLNLQDSRTHSGEAISRRSPTLNNKPNLKTISTDSTAVEETSQENICIICFEEDKNCFFQPCGHFATCYSCGLRVKEASGLCPICRKPIQVIQKIFKV